jgi:hypothetical protein
MIVDNKSFLIGWVVGVAPATLVMLFLVFFIGIGDNTLPDCTEDEVIVYENFDNPDTLYCLHVEDIYGLQPVPTPVASSMREEPK